jgi:hypothetical protein
MDPSPAPAKHKNHRFPVEIISHAVLPLSPSPSTSVRAAIDSPRLTTDKR